MLKLLILGALGFAGYRYLAPHLTPSGEADTDTPQGVGSAPVAGGPISDGAMIVSDPDQPPG